MVASSRNQTKSIMILTTFSPTRSCRQAYMVRNLIFCQKESESEVTQSCLTLCHSHGLQPTRLLCLWDFPGRNTGMGCHFLLQGIFPTQGSNPGLPHCRQMLLLSKPPGKSQYILPDFAKCHKISQLQMILGRKQGPIVPC